MKRFHVDSEVNRARCMPQNPNLVAAKTSGLEVYVFDTAKEPNSNGMGSCNPDLRLRGHEKEGYGLSWSPFKEGYLLSGSNDCNICLWDVSSMPQSKVLDAMNVYGVISPLLFCIILLISSALLVLLNLISFIGFLKY